MIGTKRLLSNCQRTYMQRLRFFVTRLLLVHASKVIQRSCNVGMIRAERFLPNRQRTSKHGLRGTVLTAYGYVETTSTGQVPAGKNASRSARRREGRPSAYTSQITVGRDSDRGRVRGADSRLRAGSPP